jgi:cation:H+ antiporter
MFLFSIGLIFLILGAKLLVNGAQQLALKFNVCSLVVGLTIVAYGTSAPELLTSSLAAYKGQGDLAIGNIVGSNIFNLMGVLGIMAAYQDLVIRQKIVWLDIPILIFANLLFWALALTHNLNALGGIILLLGLVLYTYMVWKCSPRQHGQHATWPLSWQIAALLSGIIFLAIGAEWVITGAMTIMERLQLPPLFVGLTFIAIGTALPELVTCIVAILKKDYQIAVGGIIGSNIFNIFAVGGSASLVSKTGIMPSKEALFFDIPVMLAAVIAVFPIAFTHHIIHRWEGFLLIGYYLVYLFMTLYKLPIPYFLQSCIFFVLPIAIMVFIIWLKESKKRL